MDKKEKLLRQYELEVSSAVEFGGIFAALTVFFTGLLITNYNDFEKFVRVPILLLVISTFGFIYASLIYANASGRLNVDTIDDCKRFIKTGDIMSEFMGVYAFLLAIPLVIPVITDDAFLRYSVLFADIFGLIVYHVSGFSILQRFVPKYHYLILAWLILLEAAIFLTLKDWNQALLLSLVTVMVATLFFVSLLSTRKIEKD